MFKDCRIKLSSQNQIISLFFSYFCPCLCYFVVSLSNSNSKKKLLYLYQQPTIGYSKLQSFSSGEPLDIEIRTKNNHKHPVSNPAQLRYYILISLWPMFRKGFRLAKTLALKLMLREGAKICVLSFFCRIFRKVL